MPHIPDSLHADHDPLAIAAYAAGDATGPELDDALALVAGCEACAALHHDLRSIAAALPAIPAPVRPRDFRLTPEQAASIRPAGWRRFLAPLAGPRFAFAGPLGTGLATLGIAGFLVAGSLGAPIAAQAPAGGGDLRNAASPPVAAPPAGALKAAPQPSGEPDSSLGTLSMPGDPSPGPVLEFAVPQPGPTQAAGTDAGAPTDEFAGSGSGVALSLASGLALLAGLVLAGLRLAGARLVGRG